MVVMLRAIGRRQNLAEILINNKLWPWCLLHMYLLCTCVCEHYMTTKNGNNYLILISEIVPECTIKPYRKSSLFMLTVFLQNLTFRCMTLMLYLFYMCVFDIQIHLFCSVLCHVIFFLFKIQPSTYNNIVNHVFNKHPQNSVISKFNHN